MRNTLHIILIQSICLSYSPVSECQFPHPINATTPGGSTWYHQCSSAIVCMKPIRVEIVVPSREKIGKSRIAHLLSTHSLTYHPGKCLFSTVEAVQYCGGYSVQWRMFSTVEDFQCSEQIPSALRGIPSVLWGIPSVHWQMYSTFEGIPSVL